jgi:hypothetical protein
MARAAPQLRSVIGISVLSFACLWILVSVMWSCLLWLLCALLFVLCVLVGEYVVVGHSFSDSVALASL